mgnify:CR=1 FL=1
MSALGTIQSEAQNSVENSVQRPALRRAPNGGMLYTGGVPGHAGGTGRPQDIARKLAADGITQAMPGIVAIAMGGEGIYPSQQVAAAKLLSDIGIPKEIITHPVEHNVAGVIQAVSEVLVRELGVEARDRLMDAIKQAVKDNATVTTSHTMAESPSEDV